MFSFHLKEFVLIPEGYFIMGDSFGEGSEYELPVHEVFVPSFYLARTPVVSGEWKRVRDWALGHGYSFDHSGLAKADEHPVHSVYWYDAVKWCNAKSEIEGLNPLYFTDGRRERVYRMGQVDVPYEAVRWDANGYRLPTEAEWEKAARGGKKGKRFPWGDQISHQHANYLSADSYAYDVSASRGYHPAYDGFTSPVASFPPNDYGFYDMSGNVLEWCWNWVTISYRDDGSKMPSYPAGARLRVARGGSWNLSANHARCASRYDTGTQDYYNHIGFRLARSFGDQSRGDEV